MHQIKNIYQLYQNTYIFCENKNFFNFFELITDIISANPIPIYVTNFIGGAMYGGVVALIWMVNNSQGTDTADVVIGEAKKTA